MDTLRASSSGILRQFDNTSRGDVDDISQFEDIFHSQKSFDALHYDQGYFQDEWRRHGNTYTLEKRREIEGKNPLNIKNVFEPKKVLDVGCGPGALMYFLHELGIEVYGIDFSPEARRLAPIEVRPRIVISDVTEFYDFKTSFDLVICREVMEHLTVRQITQVVRTIARYTAKYLYVTTRFYPEGEGLLKVTNDLETDPSHITLVTKDFLRLLFVMEGLRERKDMEAELDWKKYGRVLVFERA